MSETIPAWRSQSAPSLAEFEGLAMEVFRGLPENFRALCSDVVIQVEDFATDEILDRRVAVHLVVGRLHAARRFRVCVLTDYPAGNERSGERTIT